MDYFTFVVMAACLSLMSKAQELVMMVTEKHNTKQGITYRGVIYKFSLPNNTLMFYNPTEHITPHAIDYDSVGKRIYWTDVSKKLIGSADLDAGNYNLVANLNNESLALGLTIDSQARKLFYTDSGNKRISRIDLEAAFAETEIVQNDLSAPWGIIADKRNRRIYWVDHLKQRIETCNYSGGSRRVVTSSSVVGPTGIALNEQTGRLYWCEYRGRVNSMLTDGTSRREIFNEHSLTASILMDVTLYNGFLYLADRITKMVRVFSESTEASGHGKLTNQFFKDITGVSVFSPDTPPTGCADGRYGIGCTEICGSCSLDTHCEKTVGFCLSGCEIGYQGERCLDVCTAGTYGGNCSSVCGNCKIGTTCHHVTGQCESGCQSGFRGYRCDENDCTSGTYDAGRSCVPCGHCKGNDVCSSRTGSCPRGCSAGWMGSNCKTGCRPNKYWENCAKYCGFCKNKDLCNPVTGQCPNGCASGWTGSLCQQSTSGGCSTGSYGTGSSCVPCGHCQSSNVCNSQNGICPRGCSAGWMGSMCKTRCSTNRYGANCAWNCGHCKSFADCDPVTGHCPKGCQRGWTGNLCQVRGDKTSGSESIGYMGYSLVVAAVLPMLMN